MKKVKQFIAVIMTAVFIAGTFPLTLSAADTRGDAPMIFAESDTETVEDVEKQAEAETGEDAGDAEKQAEAETVEDAGKQAETEAAETAEDAGKQAEAEAEETAEDAEKQTETSEDAGKRAKTAEGIEKQTEAESGPEEESSGSASSGDAADGDNSASGSEKGDGSASPASGGAAGNRAVQGSEIHGEKPAMKAAQAVYTVTLDANSGGYYIDYSNHNTHVQTVTYTGEPEGWDISAYQIPKANPGKIFAGWSTSANGNVLPTEPRSQKICICTRSGSRAVR